MAGFPSILEGIKDLTKSQIDSLFERADDFKNYAPARLPLQKKLAVATSFLEHSTRTKHSFAMAIKKLGGFHIDFNAETSSLKKGEDLEQTLLTLYYQGMDVCIIRTNESNLLEQFKNKPPIKIINGGDGSNQHPTQALLDLYTLKETLGSLAGKTVAIIGDCKHSRVTHSLMDLLPLYNVNIILCGPEQFLPSEEIENIEKTHDLDYAIEKSDVLYMLRVQCERHEGTIDIEDYNTLWGINFERLKKHQKAPPIFHPGPANIGVEVTQDIVNSNLWCAHKQVVNSVYMRMAIIEAMVTNNDLNVGAAYNEIPGDICGTRI